MSSSRTRVGPDDAIAGSWASEALPLSVRKELLERELRRLGLPRVTEQRRVADGDAGACHAQPAEDAEDAEGAAGGDGSGD